MGKDELMKSKKTAILLAIFLGYLGIHRFYLGQIGLGILYFCTAGMFLVLPIIDIFVWITGSQESFDNKYNKQRLQREHLNVQKEMLEELKKKN